MDVLEYASLFARTMYESDSCRICGLTITGKDVQSAVFVGYSKNKAARSAHKECHLNRPPQELWAFPADFDNEIPYK